MKLSKVNILIIVFFISLLLLGNVIWAEGFEHKNGSSKDGPVSLHGNWEFYWHELIEPEDFQGHNREVITIKVPGSWRYQTVNGKPLPRFGYGTYRTQFKIPEEKVGKQQALSLYYIGSAYRIWINGREYPGFGDEGKSKEDEIPSLQRNVIIFEPPAKTIDIVIQVSNFSFREGGLISDIVFGETKELSRSMLMTTFLSLIQIGAALLFGIYQLTIYFYRKTDLAGFYIGSVSFFYACRTFLVNEYVVHMFFPSLSWVTIIKSEYLLEKMGLLVFCLLIRHIFPEDANIYIVRIFQGIAVIIIAIDLFTPPEVFTSLLFYNTIILIIIFLYLILDVAFKAKLHKRKDANLNLAGVFILIGAIIFDTINFAFVFNTFYMLNYAFIIFMLIQAAIVANRYERINEKNARLTEELLILNNHLEDKIIDRTNELREKNIELETLQLTRTKALANIAHDIGTPLAGVRAYLQILKEGKINVNHQNVYQELINKLAYVQHLNNDLLELSKLEAKKLPFHFEEVMVRQYFKEIYVALRLDIPTENSCLQLGNLTPSIDGKEAYIKVDRLRLMQVMQNFVSNAIKYNDSLEKHITLHCDVRRGNIDGSEAYEVVIEVEDNGNGISQEELPYYFEQFYRKVNGNIDGSGLGLAIVKEIIKQHGGEVGARSKQGEGAIFYFTLPAFLK